jgi:D-alanyl-D-alanine dipeptidase
MRYPNLFFTWVIANLLLVSDHAIAMPDSVLSTFDAYRQSIVMDSLKLLVPLEDFAPGIRINLVYATDRNFMHQKLYSENAKAYLRIAPARALGILQRELAQKGLGLLVWDAYRPYRITQIMWQRTTDRRFVANPRKGSNHNRGLAVDITLVNLSTGQQLPMGTNFDNFTDTADFTFADIPEQVRQNRIILRKAMQRAGFRPIKSEWWHFSWPDDDHYEIMDLEFDLIGQKLSIH